MYYFYKSNDYDQHGKTQLLTNFQMNRIKKEYGLTETEVDMLIQLQCKRNGKSFKKFIERIL